MPESYVEKLARVQGMADGDPTWDLSQNDRAALIEVMVRIARLEQVLRTLVEMYGPSSDYSEAAAIVWADAEDALNNSHGSSRC